MKRISEQNQIIKQLRVLVDKQNKKDEYLKQINQWKEMYELVSADNEELKKTLLNCSKIVDIIKK